MKDCIIDPSRKKKFPISIGKVPVIILMVVMEAIELIKRLQSTTGLYAITTKTAYSKTDFSLLYVSLISLTSLPNLSLPKSR